MDALFTFGFPVLLHSERGTILVTFPDLPEVVTEGATRDDALANARDALEVWLRHLMRRGEALPFAPPPSETGRLVAPGLSMAAKAAVYAAWRRSGLTEAEFAARPDEARQVLDPDHATRIDRLDAGLAALGRRFVVATEAASAAP